MEEEGEEETYSLISTAGNEKLSGSWTFDKDCLCYLLLFVGQARSSLHLYRRRCQRGLWAKSNKNKSNKFIESRILSNRWWACYYPLKIGAHSPSYPLNVH